MPEASTLPPLKAERSVPRRASRPAPARSPQSSWRKDAVDLLRGETGLVRLVGRRLLHRPLRSLLVLVTAILGGSIVVNAVALQTGRHPTPFFAVVPANTNLPRSAPLPPERPGALVKASDAPTGLNRDLQTQLARQGFYLGPIDGRPGSRLEIAIREFERAAGLPITGVATEALLEKVASSKLAMKDQLLLLIKDGAPQSIEQPKTIEAMQRALARLGYGPLKADGNFGAATRAALERFEREHKLPVRGEPSPRTLKELAAASGIAIE